MRKSQGFITSQDPKLSKLDRDNHKLVKQVDEVAHEVMVLIHRNQKDKDIQEIIPEIGSLVMFMNEDRKFTHLTSRLRYGLITSLSQPSMDGVSRSAYIQTFLKAGTSVDHYVAEDKNTYVTLHRKLADIIVLSTTNEKQAEESFRVDFERLAKAMQNSEDPPLTKEEIKSLRVDQLIKKHPEKREKSSPNEDTQENLPTAPRRSERWKAKKDPICGFACCISLLALLY